MPARPAWKGFLKLSLVSLPVEDLPHPRRSRQRPDRLRLRILRVVDAAVALGMELVQADLAAIAGRNRVRPAGVRSLSTSSGSMTTYWPLRETDQHRSGHPPNSV